MKIQRPSSSRPLKQKQQKTNQTISRPQTGRQNINDQSKQQENKKYHSNISNINNQTMLPPLEVVQETKKNKTNKIQELLQTQNYLKMQIHKIQDENTKLSTKSANITSSIKKMQKVGANLQLKNQMANQKKSKQQMNVNLKKQLKSLLMELKCKKQDILKLKKSQKYSCIQEEQVMKLIMREEIDRLQQLQQQYIQGPQYIIEKIKQQKQENKSQHETIDKLSQEYYQKMQQLQDQDIKCKQQLDELHFQIKELDEDIKVSVRQFQRMLESVGKKLDANDIIYCLRIENLSNEQIEIYNKQGFKSVYVDQTINQIKYINKQNLLSKQFYDKIDSKTKRYLNYSGKIRESQEEMYQSRLSLMPSNFNNSFSKLYFKLPIDHLKQTGDIIRQNLMYYQIPYVQYLESIHKLYEDYYEDDNIVEPENYGSNKTEEQKKKLNRHYLTDLVNMLLEECEVFIGENVELIVENIIEVHKDYEMDELVVEIVGHQMISIVEPFYLLSTEDAKLMMEQLNSVYKLNKVIINNGFNQSLFGQQQIVQFFDEYFPMFHLVQLDYLLNQIYMHKNGIYYLDLQLFQHLFIQETLQQSQLNFQRQSSTFIQKDRMQEVDIQQQMKERMKENYLKQLENEDINEKINEQFFMQSNSPFYQNVQNNNFMEQSEEQHQVQQGSMDQVQQGSMDQVQQGSMDQDLGQQSVQYQNQFQQDSVQQNSVQQSSYYKQDQSDVVDHDQNQITESYQQVESKKQNDEQQKYILKMSQELIHDEIQDYEEEYQQEYDEEYKQDEVEEDYEEEIEDEELIIEDDF